MLGEKLGCVQGATQLRFECHYCKAVFPNFTGLVHHFLERHAHQEYIVIETENFTNDNRTPF